MVRRCEFFFPYKSFVLTILKNLFFLAMFQTLNPNVSLIISCMFDAFALGNTIFGRGGGIV
jgi:hypothetical protein